MIADIRHGDCLELLAQMPPDSVDAVVTDPPYGLSFMGKKWDYDVPSVEIWREVLRVLKPGGHLLSFAGTRTQHRMACAIEGAGFEIRDMIAWVYGSGFPKSLDVSKAIDKAAGAEREVVGSYKGASNIGKGSTNSYITTEPGRATDVTITAPATPGAQQWAGWGTALKPALEPITMARKPLTGTVAENVLAHGVGAINVDGGRVGLEMMARTKSDGAIKSRNIAMAAPNTGRVKLDDIQSRWPANLIYDGSPEVLDLFPDGVARFFYCAKASKRDREDGNKHPTVKPTDLMRYLVRLITPPGGLVLDPFTGSGSTGKASILEGFRFLGIEREAEYVEIAKARVAHAIQKRQSVGIGGQCDGGLLGGNGNTSHSLSPVRNNGDTRPECCSGRDLYGGKPYQVLRAKAPFQQLELAFS